MTTLDRIPASLDRANGMILYTAPVSNSFISDKYRTKAERVVRSLIKLFAIDDYIQPCYSEDIQPVINALLPLVDSIYITTYYSTYGNYYSVVAYRGEDYIAFNINNNR